MRRMILNDEQFNIVEQALLEKAEEWCSVQPDQYIEEEGAQEIRAKGIALQAIIDDQMR